MVENTYRKIVEFISVVNAAGINADKVYLFGSYAKNNQHTESDIDIALIIDGLLDSEKFDLQVKLLLKAAEIDTRIEPHLIAKNDFESNNPFAVEIKKTGIEISPRNPVFDY